VWSEAGSPFINFLYSQDHQGRNPIHCRRGELLPEDEPDAVTHFGLTPDTLAEKIIALLLQAANPRPRSSETAQKWLDVHTVARRMWAWH
jgi:hypothetical protein